MGEITILIVDNKEARRELPLSYSGSRRTQGSPTRVERKALTAD
jgi:hypothetical protein